MPKPDSQTTKPRRFIDKPRTTPELFEVVRSFLHEVNVPPFKETGAYVALDALREIEIRTGHAEN